ncbi:MAG: hypothetical protein IPL42_09690, partial [Saprospiraceae bacterium]|nr:hypothetical protein [Saprospiraceae bacterium]
MFGSNSDIYLENEKQTWYFDSFINKNTGQLSNTPCLECFQIIKSQGYYIGVPPNDPEGILVNANDLRKTNFGPYGNWKFYNEKGAMLKDLNLGQRPNQPKIEESSSLALSGNNTIEPTSTILSSLEIKKPLIASIGLGLKGLLLKEDIKEYKITSFAGGDSINIYGVSSGNAILVLDSHVKFETPYNRKAYIGFSFGIGYAL